MFYSHFVYVRDGPLAKIWLASHILRQLKRSDITSLDITEGAAVLMGRGTTGAGSRKHAPFALRICGQLLLGLVRIYQRKVDLASAEADAVLRKLESVVPEEARAAVAASAAHPTRRSTAANAGKIELAASELRAREGAITLHDRVGGVGGVGGSEDPFAALGAGLDLDLMDPSELDALVGEEWIGDTSALGVSHAEFDTASGVFQLTGPQSARVSEGRQAEDEIPHDGGADADFMDVDQEIPHDDAADFPLDAPADESRVDEGRAVDVSAALGGGFGDLNATGASLAGKEDALGLSAYAEEFGAGLGGDAADDVVGGASGFEHLLPADSKPASVASGEDAAVAADVDAQLDEAQRELAASLAAATARRREQARRKRKTTSFVPQIDEATEIARDDIRRWLADPSDIVAPRIASFARGARTARAQLDSLAAESDVAAVEAASVFGDVPEEEVVSHAEHHLNLGSLFGLPSTGLGHAAMEPLAAITRRALVGADIGRIAPRLARLMRERARLSTRIPGLVYSEPSAAEEEAAAAQDATRDGAASVAGSVAARESLAGEASLATGVGDISLGGGDISQIGMDDLDFGGGEDPFTQDATQVGVSPAKKDQRSAAAEAEAAVDAEILGEELPAEGGDLEAAVPDEQPESFILDTEAADAEARDVREWWDESGSGSGGAGGDVDVRSEHVASGWSRRTKKMHALLKAQFRSTSSGTQTKPFSFERLVDGHAKAVAAGSFYQLLVLASGGHLRLTQSEAFGDILLAKTAAFDRKLPIVSSGSATATDESQTSELL